MKRSLGTCYYPEHWPEEIWIQDADRMVKAGLTWVRIGEFCWSRIEPEEGVFHWDWLDRAIDVLGAADLKIVLGTPTTAPPRWVADKYPDMFAVDVKGCPRRFGSRRHYCFSHQGYLEESRRIVEAFAARYAQNPSIAAWQTDNEYGCHDTTYSYSPAARQAFQAWLTQAFDGDIAALNTAWGNVFWSMDYNSFEQIDLPNLTVTEPNPAHVHAFKRFSSDQVVAYNRMQVETLRKYTRRPIAHNYMGGVTDFDHYKLGADLEIAGWDSYPLGFLEERIKASAAHKRNFARQGDPDFQAFHHDLYRAVGKGRWWIMEQQPGPVNWAPFNPAPLPGMVRLWTWEAFAHGAEAVCYFRWRQAPFAQEQLHAGLLRPDGSDAEAIREIRQVRDELPDAPEVQPCQAPVALIFDYEAQWSWAAQPQGRGLDYFQLVFDTYRALRRAGVSVDILPPDCASVAGYAAIFVPGVMHLPEGLKEVLASAGGPVVYGPRTAARDKHFRIPIPLPPAIDGIDVTVSRLQTLRPDLPIAVSGGGAAVGYFEELRGTAPVILRTETGQPVLVGSGNRLYCGAWLDDEGMSRLVNLVCSMGRIETRSLPEGVRIHQTAKEIFWFNHTADPVMTEIGELSPAGVFVEKRGL